MYLVKLEISNNINHNVFEEWHLFYYFNEKEEYIKKKEREREKWNSEGQSIRKYDFTEYTKDNVRNIFLDDLKNMRLGDFAKLLNFIQGQ